MLGSRHELSLHMVALQNLESLFEILSRYGQFVQYWNFLSYNNYQYLFCVSYQNILPVADISTPNLDL
jgi:hypothetical protein